MLTTQNMDEKEEMWRRYMKRATGNNFNEIRKE
jgi:hypothetical protein